jgi:hypothetical protein
MCKKHFTDVRIAFALRQHVSRTAVGNIDKLWISEQTFYRWKKFTGLGRPSRCG